METQMGASCLTLNHASCELIVRPGQRNAIYMDLSIIEINCFNLNCVLRE